MFYFEKLNDISWSYKKFKKVEKEIHNQQFYTKKGTNPLLRKLCGFKQLVYFTTALNFIILC